MKNMMAVILQLLTILSILSCLDTFTEAISPSESISLRFAPVAAGFHQVYELDPFQVTAFLVVPDAALAQLDTTSIPSSAHNATTVSDDTLVESSSSSSSSSSHGVTNNVTTASQVDAFSSAKLVATVSITWGSISSNRENATTSMEHSSSSSSSPSLDERSCDVDFGLECLKMKTDVVISAEQWTRQEASRRSGGGGGGAHLATVTWEDLSFLPNAEAGKKGKLVVRLESLVVTPNSGNGDSTGASSDWSHQQLVQRFAALGSPPPLPGVDSTDLAFYTYLKPTSSHLSRADCVFDTTCDVQLHIRTPGRSTMKTLALMLPDDETQQEGDSSSPTTSPIVSDFAGLVEVTASLPPQSGDRIELFLYAEEPIDPPSLITLPIATRSVTKQDSRGRNATLTIVLPQDAHSSRTGDRKLLPLYAVAWVPADHKSRVMPSLRLTVKSLAPGTAHSSSIASSSSGKSETSLLEILEIIFDILSIFL